MVRILLIEDDRFTRELYETLLKGEGYDLEVAEDGAAGLAKAIEGGFDLILLDIIMPKIDGLTFLRKIKEIPAKKKNKKIVMLTVLNQDEFIKNALRMGAHGYLMKSALRPDEVLAEIAVFLKTE
ncbi:MAG: response regulator [Candidatus Pacebacteria bacterium]|nr:response regulator [Candidatus Paceibacterota bacterium]